MKNKSYDQRKFKNQSMTMKRKKGKRSTIERLNIKKAIERKAHVLLLPNKNFKPVP